MKNPLNIPKYFPYIFRRRFKEKYIIIESDDWGLQQSIDEGGIEYLKRKYGKEQFTRWTTDALETVDDISRLFEVLNEYKTDFEKPPIITANFITHNIDYSNSRELLFKPMSEVLGNRSTALSVLYREGIRDGLLFPQLHGYSHYNINKLKVFFNTIEGKELFDCGFLTGESTLKGKLNKFRGELIGSNHLVEKHFNYAVNEFISFFGIKPKTIIPPHFILDLEILPLIKKNGIEGIQASNRLVDSRKKRLRKPFFRKISDIIWMPRNARLDPHPDYNFYANNCFNRIKDAFESKMPAIIDCHRVNFAGNYNRKYRDRSLDELHILLSKVKNNWPGVKFITTADLIKLCQIKII